jgi:quercetin dioxygenase-like cupin family protein
MHRLIVLSILLAGVLLMNHPDAAEVKAEQGGLKVDTKGVTATIKYEAVLQGFLTDLNGTYKLRVTEITIAPGGHVGAHNHLGPGIRQMTTGTMEYILPDRTMTYGPGDFFFEAGDISHRVVNNSTEPCTHILFEVLPVEVERPSLIPPRTPLKP